MVLESIFESKKLIKEPVRLFLLSVMMSFIGMATSFFLFPPYAGVMSVAFISLLLFPSIHGIFVCGGKTKFDIKHMTLMSVFKRHIPIFKIFFIITAGIFTTFFVLSLLSPAPWISELFKPQLYPLNSQISTAVLDFNAIAQNNLRVMYITFAISLVYGAGVMIMLSWNASVWGVIIGTTLKKGVTSATPLWAYFTLNLLQILPHLILETAGYLGAAVSGGMLAMCVVYQRIRSKQFMYSLTDAFLILTISIVLILISAFIEINI